MFTILVGKAQGRISIWRPVSTREDDFKTNLKETGSQGVD